MSPTNIPDGANPAAPPTMRSYVEGIQAQIVRQLEGAALGYLNVGIELHRKHSSLHPPYVQLIVGTLGIATELMLKSLIARHNLALLFKSLPLELRTLFACPDSLPADSSVGKVFDVELRSGKRETLEFNECVGQFKLLYPIAHAELASHLKFVAEARNVAVHNFFPHFHKYEVDRTLHVALRLLQIDLTLGKHEFLTVGYPELDDKRVDALIKAFEADRVQRVHKAQEDAKQEAKKLTTAAKIDEGDLDWDQYLTECNICHSDALLRGATEIRADGPDKDGDYDVSLEFKAHSFRCDGCGLELRDVAEMKLAGIDLVYDRSDQMDEWNEMHSDYDEEFWR